MLQWVSVLAALVGIGWLLGAFYLPTVGLPGFEIPTVEGWAVPTLLIVGGVALGVLLGLLGALFARAAAAARRRRARKNLAASVGVVVRETAVTPIVADLDRARDYSAALKLAR